MAERVDHPALSHAVGLIGHCKHFSRTRGDSLFLDGIRVVHVEGDADRRGTYGLRTRSPELWRFGRNSEMLASDPQHRNLPSVRRSEALALLDSTERATAKLDGLGHIPHCQERIKLGHSSDAIRNGRTSRYPTPEAAAHLGPERRQRFLDTNGYSGNGWRRSGERCCFLADANGS